MPDTPVTDKEWERLREEARRAMPEGLQGKSLPDVLLPYQRVFTGAPALARVGSSDLDGREKAVLVPLVLAMLVLGLAPSFLTTTLDGVAEQVAATMVQAPAGDVAAATLTTEGTAK